MSTPTVYLGDTVPVDFILKWTDGTTQNIAGASIWVGVKSVRAPAGEAPLFVVKNAAAGGSDSVVTTTSASGGAFTAYLPTANTATLTDGEEYVVGAVVQVAAGTFTAGVARFIASARLPQTLS